MTARSSRREVRNPILSLPVVVEALAEMTPEEATRWRRILLAIQADAREKAELNWRRHKGPVAYYWKATGVVCGHLAKVIRLTRQSELSL
jgi:hypothetical protein